MGNREETDPSTQSKGTGQRNGQTPVTPDVAPRAPGAINCRGLPSGVGGGRRVGSLSWTSAAVELFSLLFLFPRIISNFQSVGGLRDQFSSQKHPTPPTCPFLAWMTDLYFWAEGSHMLTLRSPPPPSKSVRKCQGIHSFFHICTQAHASCFKV